MLWCFLSAAKEGRFLRMEECLYPLLRRLMKLLGEPINAVAYTLNSGRRMHDCSDDYLGGSMILLE